MSLKNRSLWRTIIAASSAITILITSTVLLRWEADISEFVGFFWDEINSDAEIVGEAMKALFLPVVSLWWLGNSPIISHFVQVENKNHKHEVFKLTGILFLIMLVSILIDIWQIEIASGAPITPGLVIVLTAALLAGKDASMPLGFGAFFIYLAWENYHWYEPINSLVTFLNFFWQPFYDLDFAVLFSSSVLIGVLRDEIGIASLSPRVFFAVGFVCQWLSGWLNGIAFLDGGHIWDRFPGAIMTGVFMLMFGVYIQRMQGQIAKDKLITAEKAKTEAELKALRAQINPHFLFNTLSTIRYHARIKSDATYELLEDLSEVFHAALRSQQFIPLSEEFSTIRSYLALEQARFRDRLLIKWDIADEIDLTHPVPALALQTFVENGVIHGLAPQPEGGEICIIATKHSDHYLIEILDNGVGFDISNPVAKGHGIGQNNAIKRFKSLYGERFAPTIESELGSGTRVTVKIPYDLSIS